MNKNILGIDLGTSSVKLVLLCKDGNIVKSRASYLSRTPGGWMQGIKEAFTNLGVVEIDAIGLSSQVGTYIVNGRDVINWDDGIGKTELEFIKGKYTVNKFVEEIAMPHPDIVSYPIPRLMYIKSAYDNIRSICQPKDLMCLELTGNYVTDRYSYRGLAHTVKGGYSRFFLDEIGIDSAVLPEIVDHSSVAGITTFECEDKYGIPAGIPVYTGLNDFFSSLVGMGIDCCGDMFDVTGTSEHLGVIQDTLASDTKMVSGVYFDKYVQYGVTSSSGASLDFAIKNFSLDDVCIEDSLNNNSPIFTPYLNGERAPIFDADARGVFFGLSSNNSKKDMAYAVLEGVVFSLYHIYENMGKPPYGNITVSGGASANYVLNKLKAELFNTGVRILEEKDTSALGGVRIAAEGEGADNLGNIIGKVEEVIEPTDEYRDILLKRYDIYKTLYSSLKEQFDKFAGIRKDMMK